MSDCIGLNANVVNQVAQKTLDAIAENWGRDGLSSIQRRYIGMGPVPAEDCCPDLVVWASNIRIFDSDNDTLREGRVLKHFGLAFDINVRVGLCFFEMTDNGKGGVDLVETSQIQKWAEEINRYGVSSYLGATLGLVNDPQLACSFTVSPQPMYPFQEGGCAGYNFAIGIGVV